MTVKYRSILLFCGVLLSSSAFAQPFLLNGKFTGTESAKFNIAEVCVDDPIKHREFGPITVGQEGVYDVSDVGLFAANDVTISFHEGPVDPSDPLANVLDVNDIYGGVNAIDDFGDVELASGTDYYIVVQPWMCGDFEGVPQGVWAVAIDGPGDVAGDGVITSPDHWYGRWNGDEDLIDASPDWADCPDTFHDVSGPHQVDRLGMWFFSGYSEYSNPAVSLAVYKNSFDPDRPERNKVANTVGGGSVRLEPGIDYYFVTQPFCAVETGRWTYALFPPVRTGFNSQMSGSYSDPLTSGQGELMEIYPDIPLIFLAWFTWAADPSGTAPDAVGDANQRWLTMTGTPLEGNPVVDLTVYSSSGGVFNDPAPVATVPVGTATLEMYSCADGLLAYELDSGESGETTLRRSAQDNVEFCEYEFFRADTLE